MCLGSSLVRGSILDAVGKFRIRTSTEDRLSFLLMLSSYVILTASSLLYEARAVGSVLVVFEATSWPLFPFFDFFSFVRGDLFGLLLFFGLWGRKSRTGELLLLFDLCLCLFLMKMLLGLESRWSGLMGVLDFAACFS